MKKVFILTTESTFSAFSGIELKLAQVKYLHALFYKILMINWNYKIKDYVLVGIILSVLYVHFCIMCGYHIVLYLSAFELYLCSVIYRANHGG